MFPQRAKPRAARLSRYIHSRASAPSRGCKKSRVDSGRGRRKSLPPTRLLNSLTKVGQALRPSRARYFGGLAGKADRILMDALFVHALEPRGDGHAFFAEFVAEFIHGRQ